MGRSDPFEDLMCIATSPAYRSIVDASDSVKIDVRLFQTREAISDWPVPTCEVMTYAETLEAEEDTETVAEQFENGFGDCPWLTSTFLLFSQNALINLRSLLERTGELLPVRTIGIEPPMDFFAFHCMKVIDLIDVDRSEVERYPHGRIRKILRPVCHDGVETKGVLFRLNVPNPYKFFCTRRRRTKSRNMQLA